MLHLIKTDSDSYLSLWIVLVWLGRLTRYCPQPGYGGRSRLLVGGLRLHRDVVPEVYIWVFLVEGEGRERRKNAVSMVY